MDLPKSSARKELTMNEPCLCGDPEAARKIIKDLLYAMGIVESNLWRMYKLPPESCPKKYQDAKHRAAEFLKEK